MTVTTTELIEAIRKLAADNPETVYREMMRERFPGRDDYACAYQINGQAACLVGQAAVACGLDMSILKLMDYGIDGVSNIRALVEGMTEVFVIDNERHPEWLYKVQRGQDFAQMWGDAVADADELVPLT